MKGNKNKTKQGGGMYKYKRVRLNKNNLSDEHRIIMNVVNAGRNIIVHHKNGDKIDNRKDAEAEGCSESREQNGWYDATVAFCELWDSINKKRGYGWDTNPWIWVIEFEKIGAPE